MDNYVGKLTPKEMEEVERGVMIALGLDNYLSKPKTETPDSPAVVQPPLPAAVVKSFSWESEKQPAGGGFPPRSLSELMRSVTPTKSCSRGFWSGGEFEEVA